MSELIKLNKIDLISRVQSISRENNQLKTLLIRHQLLTNFYQKLYENCVQLKDIQLNENNKQIKYDLRSKQTKLLSQIRAITECDKSVSISLTKLPNEDISIKHYFLEKSTQYEMETQIQNTTKICEQMCNKSMTDSKEFNTNDTNDCNQSSNDIKTELLIESTINDVILNHKIDETDDCNESEVNNILIDLNEETMSQTIYSDISLNLLDKSDHKLVSNKVQKLFICEYCHKQYKHKKSYNNHMNQIHRYIRNEPKPEIPVKTEETNDKNLNELKISPKDNSIVCQWPDCKLKFKNRTLFLRHYSIHNESRKMCSDCGLKFDDSNKLREHMIWHSNKTNNLEVATNQLDSDLKCLSNGFQTYYKCDWISCDFICDNRLDLDKHYLKHNPNDGKLLCDYQNCNYKTTNIYNLEVHQKKAHEKVYTLL